MTDFSVDIVKAEALDAADCTRWRDLQRANPDLVSPYFRPEFTQVAAAVTPQAAVAVFRKDGRTVGYFPHQRRGGALLPLGAPLNDYHGVIAAPGEGPTLEVVARLLKATRTSVNGWIGPAASGEARQTVQVQLPGGGYDGWYAERRTSHGKFFKDKERARRSMESELGPLRVERGLRDPALLDQLIGLKREQYRRTGRHDVFACGWTADLLHALMKMERPDGFGASMAGLWAGEKLTAIEYSMHGDDKYHFWFPVYEPSLARCSPGILLSMDTMRLAAETGFSTFDFGFSGEHYKKYFCNASREVREAVILKPGLGATMSQAAVGVLGGRGEALRTSVRRRWAAIEACETNPADRLKGAMAAAGAALAKASNRNARPAHTHGSQ